MCACTSFWEAFCWISLNSFPLVRVHEILCCDFASLHNQFICILLLFESLYPAGQPCCTGLKAALCQHFILCDPNLVHKIICKSSAPIQVNDENAEIVQLNHGYSATESTLAFSGAVLSQRFCALAKTSCREFKAKISLRSHGSFITRV